jgi:hypothetical protein
MADAKSIKVSGTGLRNGVAGKIDFFPFGILSGLNVYFLNLHKYVWTSI